MSIFNCGLCKNEYNNYNKIPLSLPCGHVFCEDCLKFRKKENGIKCPKDQINYKIDIKKLPVCVPILSNLPKKKKENKYDLFCSRHPKNKITFICKKHCLFLCSICVEEHADHDLECCKVNLKTFENEVKDLGDKINCEKEKYFSQKTKLEEREMKISSHFQEQIKIIENYFSLLISFIQKKKTELIKKFQLSENFLLKNLDNQKKIFLNIGDKFIDLNKTLKTINAELLPKGKYERFYGLKIKMLNDIKQIISMENYIKAGNDPKSKSQMQIESFPVYKVPNSFEVPNTYLGEMSEDSDSGMNSQENFQINVNENCKDTLSTFLFNSGDNIFKQNLSSGERVNKNLEKEGNRGLSGREIGSNSTKCTSKFLSPEQKEKDKNKRSLPFFSLEREKSEKSQVNTETYNESHFASKDRNFSVKKKDRLTIETSDKKEISSINKLKYSQRNQRNQNFHHFNTNDK